MAVLPTPVQPSPPIAAIFGCAGPTLSEDEKRFFRDCNPFGLILFQRNCRDKSQVRALTSEFRETVGRSDAPVLIDQEGGRVARLKPPHWRLAPSAMRLGQLAARSLDEAVEAVYLNARLLAAELFDLGVTVDCAPVMDVPKPGAHDIIGDRAFGLDLALIRKLGQTAVAGFLDGSVLPVIKHIPGHGRALVDSHLDLPVVDANKEALSSDDFEAFRAVKDAPWAMTAHVVYTAVDADRPATTSSLVIADVIRRDIGFDGVLVSDDLSMKALGGSMQSRARDCLDAGCDIALHCNGDMVEMQAVAAGVSEITLVSKKRIDRAEVQRQSGMGPIQWDTALSRLEYLLGEER